MREVDLAAINTPPPCLLTPSFLKIKYVGKRWLSHMESFSLVSEIKWKLNRKRLRKPGVVVRRSYRFDAKDHLRR